MPQPRLVRYRPRTLARALLRRNGAADRRPDGVQNQQQLRLLCLHRLRRLLDFAVSDDHLREEPRTGEVLSDARFQRDRSRLLPRCLDHLHLRPLHRLDEAPRDAGVHLPHPASGLHRP